MATRVGKYAIIIIEQMGTKNNHNENRPQIDAIQELDIDALINHITAYQVDYYAGRTAVSDAYYDALMDELRRRDPRHALLAQVGSDSAADRPKLQHIMFMHSQDKVTTPAALIDWAQKIALDISVAQYKLDGVSIELHYRDGKYHAAVTRGDGAIGDDVTENVRRMQFLPTHIDSQFDGAVRGEMIMTREIHAAHFPDLANSRNTTAGLVKRKDGMGCEHIQIYCYDARHRHDPTFFRHHDALLKWLEAHRFTTVKWHRCRNVDEILAWYRQVIEQRDSLLYEIDGIVIKDNQIDLADQQRPKPRRQVAMKFALVEKITVLREVIWSQSGQNYTPIARTDPVQLAGTTVQRANLVNPRLIRELGLKIGATVAITKRGEIIPKIERLVSAEGATDEIDIPTTCATCGGALRNEDTRVICPNTACPQRVVHRIRRWINILDIKEFGEVLLQQLFTNGKIHSIADLYRLHPHDISQLERQGDRSATKALDNLHAVTSLSLAKFIAGNDIENIGELTVEKMIAAGLNSLDALVEAPPERLMAIEGIGDILADQFSRAIKAHHQEMRDILAVSGITLTVDASGLLAGHSFCFSGALQRMKRADAQDIVRAHGGAVSQSITKTLSYLVTNEPDSANSKVVQARRLGRPIITEEQFFALLGQ